MATLTTTTGTLPLAVVATDLDRTLTDTELNPVEEALEQLARLRSQGAHVILCTGRAQAELPDSLARGIFDALVLEGGAVVGTPGHMEPAQPPPGWRAEVEAWLRGREIPYILGESYISVLADKVDVVSALARRVPITFHLNRDRVDITPPGIDKAAGLRKAMRLIRAQGPVLAFGDSDNDIPLLKAAEYSVAVRNAVPDLKQVADEVAADYGGFGVARFLRERVA